MGFLQRLFGGGTTASADRGIHLYVRCNRCGAPVHVRVDPQNDLSGDEEDGFYVSKEIMDDRCFRLMRADLTFDGGRHETSREIEGGRFISAEEYEQLRTNRGQ